MPIANLRTLALRVASICVLGAIVYACSRKANLGEDPYDGFRPPPQNPLADAGLIDLDPALGSAGSSSCSTREFDERCAGANDFPCDFEGWVHRVGTQCQSHTGCISNGWFSAELGTEGCITRLQMSEPNDAFAACVAREAARARCECVPQTGRHFLGLGNDGCARTSCNAREFPCPPGQLCIEGYCEAGSGGASNQ